MQAPDLEIKEGGSEICAKLSRALARPGFYKYVPDGPRRFRSLTAVWSSTESLVPPSSRRGSAARTRSEPHPPSWEPPSLPLHPNRRPEKLQSVLTPPWKRLAPLSRDQPSGTGENHRASRWLRKTQPGEGWGQQEGDDCQRGGWSWWTGMGEVGVRVLRCPQCPWTLSPPQEL